MMGLNMIELRNADAELAKTRNTNTIPNERTRQVISSVCEAVINYQAMRQLDKPQADEMALATFRGAFLALKWSADEATSAFGNKALFMVAEGGMTAIPDLLKQFGDKVN